MILLQIYGQPAPQGSKKHVGNGRMVEVSKKVGPWRAAIVAEVRRRELDSELINLPMAVEMVFFRNRPKFHFNTRGDIKPSAPDFPATIPDLDKLVRSTCDGLTQSGVIHDDSRIVELTASKVWADDRGEGALIHISTIAKSKRYGANEYE
jgi:Holliday junction resolvase RusA-like endonuclease